MADAANTKAAALLYDGRKIEAEAMLTLALKLSLDADIVDQSCAAITTSQRSVPTTAASTTAWLLEQGVRLARERGDRSWERQLLAQAVYLQACRGEWDGTIRMSA